MGQILIVLALLLLSQHISTFITGAMIVALLLIAIHAEEKENLEKFGSAYKEYMERVLRLNIIAEF